MSYQLFDLCTNRIFDPNWNKKDAYCISHNINGFVQAQTSFLNKTSSLCSEFERGLQEYSQLFQDAKVQWLGCKIESDQRSGIVRQILPIIDEITVSFRLLCEETSDIPRAGRTGSWFIANPNLTIISYAASEHDDSSFNLVERIMIYDQDYRQSNL